MQCPRCHEQLEPRHRGGVEIDVCPRCGGVWLDRGELDRLAYEDDDGVIGAPVDAPAQDVGTKPREPKPRRKDERRDRDRDRDDDRRKDTKNDKRKRKKRKKESFGERLADALEDIFD